ncbi:sugar nucleotide-binding protein [Psychrobacillus vulpis]|uniref:Sugar nucleotide-binding protein n=1 Tax=Psychrobacillus vulpis TaxID=2325572 RepID=A0A544TPN6_9BACI|nr:sugar nucleotide-binding protein [Psychrobacillus vulpis]
MEKVIKQLEPDVVIWSLMNGEKENVLIDIGLTNVLAAIQKDTKLIYISTDALFVDGIGDYIEADQKGSLPKDAPLSTYVNAKRRAESIIKRRHVNHVILRTSPLYGEDFNQNIEQRTQRILIQIKEKQYTEATQNLYKTFVHVHDLAKAILEISVKEYTGILHLGPMQNESYYTFYKKRLKQLGYDNSVIQPHFIKEGEIP